MEIDNAAGEAVEERTINGSVECLRRSRSSHRRHALPGGLDASSNNRACTQRKQTDGIKRHVHPTAVGLDRQAEVNQQRGDAGDDGDHEPDGSSRGDGEQDDPAAAIAPDRSQTLRPGIALPPVVLDAVVLGVVDLGLARPGVGFGRLNDLVELGLQLGEPLLRRARRAFCASPSGDNSGGAPSSPGVGLTSGLAWIVRTSWAASCTLSLADASWAWSSPTASSALSPRLRSGHASSRSRWRCQSRVHETHPQCRSSSCWHQRGDAVTPPARR